jgi:hypothetical protein
MPTLEPVCKRLFSQQEALLKCVLGGLLLAVPVGHFFAFGFFYALIDRARRGEDPEFPSWSTWRRLFIDGVIAFALFAVLGLVPIFAGWMLSWPLRSLRIGALTYLPLIPGLLLAAPLTAAGIYQYQKKESFSAAFNLSELAAMLESTRTGFGVPTLALIGFLAIGYPLMPVTLFMGLAGTFPFYAAFFRAIEESRKGGTRSPYS